MRWQPSRWFTEWSMRFVWSECQFALPLSLQGSYVLDMKSFWDRVEKQAEGCWLWTGPMGNDGYGRLRVGGWNGKRVRAHRHAYELVRGPIPDGAEVCHRCDVPRCINPEHLFVDTHHGNILDAVGKNRMAHGSYNGRAKLSESDARVAVGLQRRRFSHRELAHGFAVHPRTIGDLLRGKNWRRATGIECAQSVPEGANVSGSGGQGE